MDNGMAQVLESVFGKRELEAVSVEEIRELIAAYPSFNAAHYFLSRKLKDADAVAYAAATRQTALYFNNPLWLQLLLEDQEPASILQEKFTVNDVFHAAREERVTVNEILQPEPEPAPTINEMVHNAEAEVATVNETFEHLTQPSLNEITGPVSDEAVAVFESSEQATRTESLLNETFGGINQEDTVTADLPQPDPVFDDNPAFEWPGERMPGPAPVSAVADDMQEEDDHRDEKTNEALKDLAHEPDFNLDRMSADLAAAASELSAPRPVESRFDEKKAKSIVFEPYHTIDYFASQGIKLVLEDQPTDSFGRQLKSFTEWLKTMKRLPVQPLTGKADETETAEVKHFAADSVEDRDILTETMAEVLVKQGMIDNAIAIYGKLSLIYPHKSAYFAARIEQLKASRK